MNLLEDLMLFLVMQNAEVRYEDGEILSIIRYFLVVLAPDEREKKTQ